MIQLNQPILSHFTQINDKVITKQLNAWKEINMINPISNPFLKQALFIRFSRFFRRKRWLLERGVFFRVCIDPCHSISKYQPTLKKYLLSGWR